MGHVALKLRIILLPHPLESWDCGHVPSELTDILFLEMLMKHMLSQCYLLPVPQTSVVIDCREGCGRHSLVGEYSRLRMNI